MPETRRTGATGRVDFNIVSHRALDDHGGSVAKNFSNTSHDFRGVVPYADYGIRTQLLRVLEHELERVGARPLAEVRVEGNIAAKQRLQARANVSNDAA
jgi:hypothetical protein